MPSASLVRALDEWTARQIVREPDESTAPFFVRRWAEWQSMLGTPAWGDFIGMVLAARDDITRDLVRGTPNRFGERGDDEKRAMIHALNVVLSLPEKVERDSNEAREAIRRFAESRN